MGFWVLKLSPWRVKKYNQTHSQLLHIATYLDPTLLPSLQIIDTIGWPSQQCNGIIDCTNYNADFLLVGHLYNTDSLLVGHNAITCYYWLAFSIMTCHYWFAFSIMTCYYWLTTMQWLATIGWPFPQCWLAIGWPQCNNVLLLVGLLLDELLLVGRSEKGQDFEDEAGRGRDFWQQATHVDHFDDIWIKM